MNDEVNHSASYRKAWNSVVAVFQQKRESEIDFFMESFRDAANRNLLMYKNIDASNAILACTDEYANTNNIPQLI